MSFVDQEDDIFDTYVQEGQNQVDKIIVNIDPQIPMVSPEFPPNSELSATKLPSPIVGTVSNKPEYGVFAPANFKFNSFQTDNYSFFPDAAHGFYDKWRYNFDKILGPSNTAFIDATLSYKDIAWECHLEYNPNGVLWRVSAAGIPHPDDYNSFLEQNRVIEEATDRSIADMKSDNMDSGPGQTGDSNGNKLVASYSGNSINGNLTQDNISDIIKEQLLAKGINGIIIGGQYIDITGWDEKYNEIQKKMNDLLKAKEWGRVDLLNSDLSGVKRMVATDKFTVIPIDYNFTIGYDPFPFFPFTPKGTQDYYFTRAGRQAYHMLASEAWDLAPTTVDVLVTTVPALWELKPYYSSIKPAISAVCEVEKNMHVHWKEVEDGDYTYLSAIKQSLLPLGLELGPVGYTAKNCSDAIARKYGLPEAVKPVLENILSKIMVNTIEHSADI